MFMSVVLFVYTLLLLLLYCASVWLHYDFPPRVSTNLFSLDLIIIRLFHFMDSAEFELHKRKAHRVRIKLNGMWMWMDNCCENGKPISICTTIRIFWHCLLPFLRIVSHLVRLEHFFASSHRYAPGEKKFSFLFNNLTKRAAAETQCRSIQYDSTN